MDYAAGYDIGFCDSRIRLSLVALGINFLMGSLGAFDLLYHRHRVVSEDTGSISDILKKVLRD